MTHIFLVLDAFAKEGDAVSAEKLLNEMHSRAGKSLKSVVIAKPDTYSYTSVRILFYFVYVFDSCFNLLVAVRHLSCIIIYSV